MIKPFTAEWYNECWGRVVTGIGAGKGHESLALILQETASDRYSAGEADLLKRTNLHEITAESLVKRALMNLKPRNVRTGHKKARWAVVMETFGLGSTYAKDLCRQYGLDPDEMLKR